MAQKAEARSAYSGGHGAFVKRYRAPSTKHVLIAVDPGVRSPGVAWGDPSEGVEALKWWSPVSRPINPAQALVDKVGVPETHALIVEWPQKYASKSACWAAVDQLRDMADALPWKRVTKVSPRIWKGSIPKPVHHLRLRSIVPKERHAEWESASPDARDAAALWMWATELVDIGGVPR